MTDAVLATERPVARKAHRCSVCLGTIASGDTYLRQRQISDGEPVTFKIHLLCDVAYWRAHRDLALWSDEWVEWDEVQPWVLRFFSALCVIGGAFPQELPDGS